MPIRSVTPLLASPAFLLLGDEKTAVCFFVLRVCLLFFFFVSSPSSSHLSMPPLEIDKGCVNSPCFCPVKTGWGDSRDVPPQMRGGGISAPPFFICTAQSRRIYLRRLLSCETSLFYCNCRERLIPAPSKNQPAFNLGMGTAGGGTELPRDDGRPREEGVLSESLSQRR